MFLFLIQRLSVESLLNSFVSNQSIVLQIFVTHLSTKMFLVLHYARLFISSEKLKVTSHKGRTERFLCTVKQSFCLRCITNDKLSVYFDKFHSLTI